MSTRRLFAAFALNSVFCFAHAGEESKSFNIDAQPLAKALLAFSEQSNVVIVVPQALVEGKSAPAIHGTLTSEEALETILRNSGLTYQKVDEKTIAVRSSNPLSSTATGWTHLAQLNAAPDDGSAVSGLGSSSASPESARLEEIVVTAQKREERLQEVPFGISAFGAKDLERMGASSAEDYLELVPGAHYNSAGRGRSRIVIRGVATDVGPYVAGQTTVERYIDELPLTERYQTWTESDLNTYDMARVEVLRGPQTLFGSGALGGVVRLITNSPDMSNYRAGLEVGVATTNGGADSNTTNAMINVPLVQDKLALRLVGWREREGGYIDDIANQDVEENYNDALTSGLRAIVSYKPTSSTSARLMAYHSEEEVSGSASSFGFAADGGPYDWDPIHQETSDVAVDLYSLTIDHDFGPATLTSTTVYGKRSVQLTQDWIGFFAGGVANINSIGPDNETSQAQDSKRVAQELRLASTGEGPLQWTLGGSYSDYELLTHQVWRVPDPSVLFLQSVLILDQYYPTEVTETVAFGDLTYHFTEQLSVTAGARWFDTEFSQGVYGPVLNQAPGTTEASNSSVLPRVSMSYRPNEDLHIYATAAQGYRIGTNNGNTNVDPSIPAGSDPDSLWNYEVGIKSDWFDHRLHANVAAYYIDWSDIQVQTAVLDSNGQFIPFSSHTANAGQAEIRGLEAELSLQATEALLIGTSMTYTDAELVSVDPGALFTPGSTLPGSPEFSATTYVQYEDNITSDVSGYVRLTHRYVGEVFQYIDNTAPLLTTPSYNAFDLRAGVYFDNYELAVYAENLGNSDAIVSGGGSGWGFAGYETNPVVRLRPRTIGVTFRANF